MVSGYKPHWLFQRIFVCTFGDVCRHTLSTHPCKVSPLSAGHTRSRCSARPFGVVIACCCRHCSDAT